MARLSRRDAAIIGAFTGVALGPFEDIQAYGDHLMGRPTWTHEYGSRDFWADLKEKSQEDFFALCAEREQEAPSFEKETAS
jgi:hypothetical protein